MPNNEISKFAIRSFAIPDDAVNEKERRVKLVFMTEKPCRNWGIPEVCLCKKENVDTTRFKMGVMPLLFNHDSDKLIGRNVQIVFDKRGVSAEAIFDKDPFSEELFQKVLSGSLRAVSVGYLRGEVYRVEKDQEFQGVKYKERTDVCTKWEPLEDSMVTIPADPHAGVGRAFNDKYGTIQYKTLGNPGDTTVKTLSQKKENENMPMTEEEIKAKIAEAEAAAQKKVQEATEKAEKAAKDAAAKVEAEKTRTLEIQKMCRTFGIEADTETKFISDETSVEDARKSIMEELAKKQTTLNVKVTADAKEKFRAAAVDALLLKSGITLEKPAPGAVEMRKIKLRSLAQECMEREGVQGLRYMDDDEIFTQLVTTRAMGSGQFQSIIDDYAHKEMGRVYAAQAGIFKNFVSLGSNSDFNPNHKYEIGLDGEPEEMPPESSEFKYQQQGDASVSTTIKTYGKAISLNREIFINDKLGVVQRIIGLQMNGFRRLQEKQFFQTLLKVPFSNAKGNLVKDNLTISAKAYDEMSTLMMQQKDLEDKDFIGVDPSFILCASGYQQEHKQLLHSTADPAANNSGVANTAQNQYQLFKSPYLTGAAYYAIAAPSQMDGIEFTTLNNNDTPQSRTVYPSSHLGLDIQYWMDWGFNILSYKAFVKNPMA